LKKQPQAEGRLGDDRQAVNPRQELRITSSPMLAKCSPRPDSITIWCNPVSKAAIEKASSFSMAPGNA